jgi:hypothetical protein
MNEPDSAAQPDAPPEMKMPKKAPGEGKHLLYATELLLFSVVAWGWIAIREAMGRLPVLDVALFISILVASSVNLFMAIFLSTSNFRPFASACFSHAACVLLLYIYSLIESTTPGQQILCCGANTTRYSLDKTYASGFFGATPAHQIPAAVSLAFLIFYLVVAGGQATACADRPGLIHCLAKGSGFGANCLLTLHPYLMATQSPVCKDNVKDFAGVTVFFASLGFILMLDFRFLTIFIKKDIFIYCLAATEFTVHLLIVVFANILAMAINADQRPSYPLLIIMSLIFLANFVTLGLDLQMRFILYTLKIIPIEVQFTEDVGSRRQNTEAQLNPYYLHHRNLRLDALYNSKRK